MGAIGYCCLQNRGSLPEDIIKPDTEHSQPDKPPTMLRIDGLLLGPGSCRTMDVWLQEPELDVRQLGRFFGISDKSCKIFFSEFYQIMPCIMFADN